MIKTTSLRALASEVTRVTLEVGSQGKLGGQADVPDVEGVWFELVRNVYFPLSLLSSQANQLNRSTECVLRSLTKSVQSPKLPLPLREEI